jgi:hypothetical protein
VVAGAGVADVERLGEREDGGELELAGGLAAQLGEGARDLVAVDDRAVAAEVLGGGGGAVGGAEQRDAVAPVRGRGGDAEAECHADGRVGEAAVSCAAEPLGHDERAALVRLRKQQRELLAADAGGVVDAALPFHRVGGDCLEGGVAGLVPLVLVDRPEAVDVADDHGEGPVGAQRAVELDLEHLLEGAPVQEAGERVGAIRVVDPRTEARDALALMQDDARQDECAGSRD